MNIPKMQELLEAGVHFGHQTRKWHPKMAAYIFGAKDGVHIIDLEKTVDQLSLLPKLFSNLTEDGGKVLFVGTKRQAAPIVEEEAKRVGVPYITERWVGGLITNFSEIKKNIEKLTELEEKRASGEFEKFTKKERLLIDRQIAKLEKLYGGVRDLDDVPAAIFVVDVKREETACREAKRKGITVLAICDTNANLDLVDFPIPGNDDAVKSVKILTKTVADAILAATKVTKEAGTKETLLRPTPQKASRGFAGQAKETKGTKSKTKLEKKTVKQKEAKND